MQLNLSRILLHINIDSNYIMASAILEFLMELRYTGQHPKGWYEKVKYLKIKFCTKKFDILPLYYFIKILNYFKFMVQFHFFI